jgi:hypothetical protein
MQKQTFSLAVGALLLSAGAVSAATLTDNLNLRQWTWPQLRRYRRDAGRIRCTGAELRPVVVPRRLERHHGLCQQNIYFQRWANHCGGVFDRDCRTTLRLWVRLRPDPEFVLGSGCRRPLRLCGSALYRGCRA